MTTYDVGLYQAQKIYNEFGNDVIDKVERYLEASTENVSDSLSVSQNGTISIPEQCKDTSFTTTYPCDPTFDATYNGIYEWWEDYTRCQVDNLASDSNLLITDCDGVFGGGTAEGGSVSDSTRAFANVNAVENLPYLTNYDASGGAFSMAASIHEVGHNIIAGVSDDDGDGFTEHDLPITPLHNDEIYGTPMGASYYSDPDFNNFNECDQKLSQLETSRHIDFRFSGCAGKKMG